jgi:hypothetical protein
MLTVDAAAFESAPLKQKALVNGRRPAIFALPPTN